MTGTSLHTRADWNPDVFIDLAEPDGLVRLGSFTGVVPSDSDRYAVGCILVSDDDGTVYSNIGTSTSPNFSALGGGSGAVDSVNGLIGDVILDTDLVPEGVVNLYWTQTRFDDAFDLKTTDDLTEGLTNFYYHTALFDADFANQTTDDLTEGVTNLYYDDALVIAATDGLYVHLIGNESVAGIKTFSDFMVKSGSLTPINPNQFTTKDYVDAFALGFRFKQSVQAATVSPLPASTYNNGVAGVGATLTANANGLIPDIDTYTLQLNDRVLIKDQVDPIENGIYTVTALGSGGAPWILTRATDFDSTATVGQGSATLVLNGTAYNPPATNGNYASQFAVLTMDPITIGTDQIIWSRISIPLQYFAGTGLQLTGTTFSIDTDFSPITVENGNSLFSTALNAGTGATNATESVFFGTDSGLTALNATQSVFIGNQSGRLATNAQSSVFIGSGAGFNATSAAGSNFIGRDSGSGATGAFSSVFFGNGAGSAATNAQHAVFLGTQSGQGATNAAYAIFIGDQSGFNDTVSSGLSSAILIGRNTSTGGFDNSIAMGGFATNTAANQFLINTSITQFSMRGLNYLMPSAHVAGSLINDGLGNLTWGAATSQFQFLRNTIALTRTSSTVLTLVPSMTANVTAGKTYQFNATLFTTSGAGGVKAAITLAGGATGTIIYQGETIQNATAITSSRATVNNTAVGAVTAVTAATIHITGTFVCTVGGVMRVTFGQNVSNAAASSVLANSIYQVTQIN